ncbi:MAG: radical SAM protein [Deltaproteobacteria bacterium]|nr:MAG: radical SAM protein [Deltaproteobacteria bacterium]
MQPVPAKRDRDAAFFGFTRSICPSCKKVLDAHIVLRGGQVFLQKKCPSHGPFEVLISSDADYYLRSLTYTKPGTYPLAFETAVEHGCPSDCGLCEDHLQHTCSPIFEINDKCDLTCPVCIVRNQQGYSISMDHFRQGVDKLMAKEGELPTLILSGGEPTLHPQFFDFIDYCLRGPHAGHIKRVLISTHGKKLARDPRFAEKFPGVYPKLRGVELIDQKMKAIEVIRELDIPTVLVPTISKGDNSDELGDLINFGVELPQCSSIVIQPMAHTGDGGDGFHATPTGHRLTMPEVHELIERGTGWLKKEHFHPVPCSHPSCYTATYLFRMNDGRYLPLPEFVDVRQYLDAMVNQTIIRTDDKLERMILDGFLSDTFNSRNPLTVAEIERRTETRAKAIFIHAFMDPWDLDVARLKKCCTHYVMPDGRLMPGCSYNNLYRHKDPRFFPRAEPVSPEPVRLDDGHRRLPVIS